ncbi:hypothetical protein HZB02_06240 [Candidatus Woesearchaeota archaeon]|nr:hypothetical protein [Candidatus Woesearchaeota archaeon]
MLQVKRIPAKRAFPFALGRSASTLPPSSPSSALPKPRPQSKSISRRLKPTAGRS